MKITAIKTFIVDGGFRPWTFVKVETSEPGLVGWGDCTDWGSPGPVAATVARYAEWVIGRDPMQVEAIWWDLSTASMRHVGGIAWKAMAGIDSALWDIRGKVLGAPVWQLLGGKLRDELRLYWSHCGTLRTRHADRLNLPWVKTSADLRELAVEVRERGYTALKTNLLPLDDHPAARPLLNRLSNHPGDCPPDVIRNAELVVGVFRDELGPDVGIALDVAFTFKLGGAIQLARALELYRLMWLETETLDPHALRTVRESTRTTICTGESLFGLHGYKPFLELHAQDVIMPDFAWNGITMGKKICDLAHAYDTLIAPHNCHSPLSTLVAANIAATVPNFFILEIDQDDAPWRDDLLTHPFEIRQGHLQLPTRPGLGSDLIEAELLKHPATHYPGMR
jgi:L-alanine-DL-glutamate epimerase-like enolase superfamily enzyme